MQGQPAHKHRPITSQLEESCTQGQPAPQASTSLCGNIHQCCTTSAMPQIPSIARPGTAMPQIPSTGSTTFRMQGQPAHKHRPTTSQVEEPCTQGQPAPQASTSWCGTHTQAAQCQECHRFLAQRGLAQQYHRFPAQGQRPFRMQG